MPLTIDAFDRQIIALLMEDGRASSAEITRRLGCVSERAVRYRIDRLLRHGAIRVRAIVNPQALDYAATGDVVIEVAPGTLQSVAQQLVELDNVSYVAGSVGDGDLSIQLFARDTEDLLRIVDEVIGKIPGVLRTRTIMVPWKLKDIYDWRVPVPVDERGGVSTEVHERVFS